MRLAIASDIHGSAKWCEKFLKAADEERADEIILLGDILYHGPRNEEPEGYDPKGVAAMLNERAGSIVAARGNCDAEVDQMMLEFPCMGDYALVLADGMRLFCTHGHVFGSGLHNSVNNMPKLPKGSAFFVRTHAHQSKRARPASLRRMALQPGQRCHSQRWVAQLRRFRRQNLYAPHSALNNAQHSTITARQPLKGWRAAPLTS